ncbi:hypothetical protein K438DRAFT_1764794 [Mycena galopus ATCC 62051]|nr:hypothetical protein K438DRAFT_1764794 [Mycena galopus ATCC 62051]
MSESSQLAYTNRPLNKKLKPELQAIASAMGQDPKQSVLLLHECIQKYMTVHPEAADDPKFLPLFAHRSAPKRVVKNSADKVAKEVAASSEAAPKATTGPSLVGGLQWSTRCPRVHWTPLRLRELCCGPLYLTGGHQRDRTNGTQWYPLDINGKLGG